MIAFLKLIKFPNILLITLAQLCIRYGLFEPFRPYGIQVTLNSFGLFLLLLSTVAIASAGAICIALYKYDTPQLPKSISVKTTHWAFMILNILGVGIGFYVANIIERPIFVTLFIIASIGFYMYATYLKEILIVKNVTIAFLISLALLSVGLFDLLPSITATNQSIQKVCFSIVFDYSIFAFILALLWTLLQDTTTRTQDHANGIQSIPVLLGQHRTLKIISGISILTIIAVVYYVYTYLFASMNSTLLALLGIVAPLLYISITSWTFEAEKRISSFRILLTFVSIIAALSLLSYQFVLR